MQVDPRNTALGGGIIPLVQGPNSRLAGVGKTVSLSGDPQKPMAKPSALTEDMPMFILLIGGAVVAYLLVAGEMAR